MKPVPGYYMADHRKCVPKPKAYHREATGRISVAFVTMTFGPGRHRCVHLSLICSSRVTVPDSDR